MSRPADPSRAAGPNRGANPPANPAANLAAADQEHFQLVESLFRRATAAATPAERTAIVADSGLPSAVRDEVLELLAEDLRADSPLDGLPADGQIAGALIAGTPRAGAGLPAADTSTTNDPTTATSSVEIPGYTIQRVIGRGGMGVVYEAEQEEPRRPVAIKLLAGAVPSPAALARFRREWRALARLDHPAITGIHRAGTVDTAAGSVPWFSMDLIDGEPVSATSQPNVRRTLTMLADIADGVQHAHSRGVIHRDLKPGNIRVDRDGHPRIVDFGVARLSREAPDDPSLVTAAGQLIGTPAYMAPEQATGDHEAVDARADVYALGAVAYEVLSGQRPLDAGDRSFEQQLRMVREHEPPSLTSIAPRLPRDVSAVVARALAKDPERRYPTAAALADDLRRVRDGLPVSARPPSSVYLLRRLASRHRAVTITLGASAALLVGALVLISVLLTRSRAAESAAVIARDDAQRQQRIAESQASISDGVRAFLVDDVLGPAGPEATERDTSALDELLERTIVSADERFADQPLVAAEVHGALGSIQHDRGNFEASLEHFDRFDALRASAASSSAVIPVADPLGDEEGSERMLRQRLKRGMAMSMMGRGDQALADLTPLHEAAIERRGPDDSVTIRVGLVRAWAEAATQDFDAAIDRQRSLAGTAAEQFGPEHALTHQAEADLAQTLQNGGRHGEAEALLTTTFERTRRVHGPDAWSTISAAISLGQLRSDLGQDERAWELFLEARDAFERRGTAPGRQKLTILLSNMGLNRMYVGETDEAQTLLEASLENARIGGHDHLLAASSARQNLAGLHLGRGELGPARDLLLRAQADRRRILPADDIELLMTTGLLGRVHHQAGEFAEAKEAFEAAWAGFAKQFGERSPYAVRTAQDIVGVYRALDDAEGAAVWIPRATPASAETPPPSTDG
ncbi:MAG: tetratricopeptide repeat protein [Phycisphaerales bacterium]